MSPDKHYHRKYYRKRKESIFIYLGGKCVVCGSTENLDIDHINREEKSFNLSRRLSVNVPEVREELNKCQLLCRVHHREKTASEMEGFTHGTLYAWSKKKCVCSLCLQSKHMWYSNRNKKRRIK